MNRHGVSTAGWRSSIAVASNPAAGPLVKRPFLRPAMAGLGLALGFVSGASFGQDDTEARLQRVERLLDSGVLTEMLDELDLLRNEVRDLRGELEEQAQGIARLRQGQRDLYLGLDQRLLRVEQAGAGAAPASDVAAAPAAPVAAPEVEAGASGPAPGPAVVEVAPPEAGASAADAIVATGATGDPAGTGEAATAGGEAGSAPPAIDPAREQQDYQAAFDLLTSERYEDAERAFRSFLVTYPGGQFADNAQYWLGETCYVMRRFETALQEFNGLIANFPQSPKLTHAMLKVGYIHDELGRPEEAKEALGALIEGHPDSTAADLARKRLQRLRSE